MKAVGIAVAAVVTSACICSVSYLGIQPGPSFGAPLSDWLSTIVFIVVGTIPLFAAAISFRSVKHAAFLCLFGLLFLGAWLAALQLSHADFPPLLLRPSMPSPSVNVEELCFVGLSLLLPGLFWVMADKFEWQSSLEGLLSLRWKAVGVIIVVLAVSIGIVLCDAYSVESGECHFTPPPFVGQELAGQSVFTGRLIWSHLVWPSKAISRQHPELFRKYVAIAIVEKNFWGLPKWNSLVVLTYLERGPYHYYEVGQSYFVDGRRESGAMVRFLPMFNLFCTRTKVITDAQVDLRVIHDGPPRNGIRILGETVRSSSDYRLQPVSGAKVVIDGASGRIVVTSDQYGVYDAPNLPPGIYNIGNQLEDGQIVWQHPICIASDGNQPIRVGDVRDCTVVVR